MKRKKSGMEMTMTINQQTHNPFFTPIFNISKYLHFIYVGGLNNRPLSCPWILWEEEKGCFVEPTT